MQILKPSELQFSCTCLQYDFNFDQLDELIQQLRKRGFDVGEKTTRIFYSSLPLENFLETISARRFRRLSRTLKDLVLDSFKLFLKGRKKYFSESYSVKRAINASIERMDVPSYLERGEYTLSYGASKDVYRVPEDFERALDCLRLSFVASDLDAGIYMYFGEPVGEMLDCGSEWALGHQRRFIHWLFADITDKCNLACDFCYRQEHSDHFISIEDFKKALDEFKAPKRESKVGVTLGGGEPTLHPELEKLLEIAREKCNFVTLTTNGTNPGLIKNLSSYLDGVCVSAPFVYSETPPFSYALSAKQISDAVKEIAEKVKKVCISTIVTSEMQPDDVLKAADFAKKADATDLLFLMYKPGNPELVPSREHARDILEKILEVHYKSMPASIDACFAARTVWQRCDGLAYARTDGRLLKEYCPFSKEEKCVFKR
jgi:molybdenum cofactor biosynthesis enzyme MoaA